MKLIHQNVLDFIDGEDENGNIYQNLIKMFEDHQISSEKYDFQLFLQMLSTIIGYHYRGPNFFEKIEKILFFFKDAIQRLISLSEIFDIFKSCERIILFLIEEEIINVNNSNIPEMTKYLQSKYFSKNEDENIKEKRKKGENDSLLCEQIRNDSLDEFISNASKNNIDLNSIIESSIFETNPSLKEKTSLIEYASFYGSVKIFKYLQLNKVELSSKLWFYVIHGRCYEIIHILEDNLENIDYEKCFSEAVKCHHNEIADYFMNELDSQSNDDTGIMYYNFSYINHFNIIEQSDELFNDLCYYNYFNIVKILVETCHEEERYIIDISSNYCFFKIMFQLYFFNPFSILSLVERLSIEFVNFLANNKKLLINNTFITTFSFL